MTAATFLAKSRELAAARREAAQEFLRLAALAGPKANTYYIQQQIDAEYAERLTILEAELEFLRTTIKEA